MSAPEAPPTDSAWERVLERLVANRAELVDDFVARLKDARYYVNYQLPHEDLRDAAQGTMDLLIGTLTGQSISQDLRDLPIRLGTRRARQGVAREHLMEAVRLDFRVLWAGLLRACNDESPEVLVLHTESLLTAVERYASEVQAAYLAERSRLDSDSETRAWRALGRLLGAGSEVVAVAEEVAPALGFSSTATFELAAVVGEELVSSRPYGDGARRHFVRWDQGEVTVLIREERDIDHWKAALPDTTGVCVTGIVGLAAVPEAIAHTARLARLVVPKLGRVTTESAILPAMAHELIIGSAPELRVARSQAAKLIETQGDQVLTTVFEFASTGSVKSTAATLYCHRNTVVNRLEVFRALTSFNMMHPGDAARALIAFGPEYSAFLQRRS